MFRFLRQALRQFVTEWRRLAAVKVLSRLDDQLLADIGLRREQLRTLEFETPSEDAQVLSPKAANRLELAPCG
jgi:uncharacterized protein YjiS (DUF1127 family)